MSGFPERPRGEPGGIEAAAAAVEDAVVQLGLASATLQQASAGMDWSGYAQAAYRSAGEGLSAVATTANDGLERVATVARRYAADLEAAQTRLDQLRGQYEDARRRAADARAEAAQLSGARAQAIDPVAASALDGDIARAADRAASAEADADALLRRAVTVRDEFDAAARAAAGDLDAAGGGAGTLVSLGAPGAGVVGARSLAPGFGVPLGGLGDLAGVVPVHKDTPKELPGFGTWRNDELNHHGQTEVDDLTNAIMLAGPGAVVSGVGRVLVVGGQRGGRAFAAAAGLQSTRKVTQEAGSEAFESVMKAHRPGPRPFGATVKDARQAARAAKAEAWVRLRERQGDTLETLLTRAGDLGVPVPPGLEIVLPELVRRGHMLPGFLRSRRAAVEAAVDDVIDRVRRGTRGGP